MQSALPMLHQLCCDGMTDLSTTPTLLTLAEAAIELGITLEAVPYFLKVTRPLARPVWPSA